MALLLAAHFCAALPAFGAQESEAAAKLRAEQDRLQREQKENERLKFDAVRAEIDRLKSENAALRAQAQANDPAPSNLSSSSEVTRAQYEQVIRDNDRLKEKVQQYVPISDVGAVDAASQQVENRYGPNAGVTTREGKLTMGGLVQVWYYSIQNDHYGYADPNPNIAGPPAAYASNEVADNDSFRVRRAQLRFTMDIHENVTAYVQIDPSREADSFPTFPSNVGSGYSGEGVVFTNPGLFLNEDLEAIEIGNTRNNAVRNGTGSANRLLEEAWINLHGVIPHHELSIGQMRRRIGEEGSRDDGKLDFVERSMVTQLAAIQDLGAMAHGTWWDDRFQYWVGVFNGAGAAFEPRYNRSDDNDPKDVIGSVLLRPLWNDETWGSIELGGSFLYGAGGESGSRDSNLGLGFETDGLNRNQTVHRMIYAYGMYRPGGPVRGWWIRGEWGRYDDRWAPGAVLSVPTSASGGDDVLLGPGPISVQGWYLAFGYRLSQSYWGDTLRDSNSAFMKHVLEPFEFVARYEAMENLHFIDFLHPQRRTNEAKTEVFTVGCNWYLKGNNAKLQINYNWVDEDQNVDIVDDFRHAREVHNDNFIVNFQVAW